MWCLCSFPQVPDSHNNNYVAWKTMIINHKPGKLLLPFSFTGIHTAPIEGDYLP